MRDDNKSSRAEGSFNSDAIVEDCYNPRSGKVVLIKKLNFKKNSISIYTVVLLKLLPCNGGNIKVIGL